MGKINLIIQALSSLIAVIENLVKKYRAKKLQKKIDETYYDAGAAFDRAFGRMRNDKKSTDPAEASSGIDNKPL